MKLLLHIAVVLACLSAPPAIAAPREQTAITVFDGADDAADVDVLAQPLPSMTAAFTFFVSLSQPRDAVSLTSPIWLVHSRLLC